MNEIIDVEAQLDESMNITFSVITENIDRAERHVRLVIVGEKMSCTFNAPSEQSGETVNINIPVLKGVFNEGVYDAMLEVIVGERIYTPLKMKMKLNGPPKCTAIFETTQRSGPVASIIKHDKIVDNNQKNKKSSLRQRLDSIVSQKIQK